jgi:hypothetical protein
MTISLLQLNVTQRNVISAAGRLRPYASSRSRRFVARRLLDGPKLAFPPRATYRPRPAI